MSEKRPRVRIRFKYNIETGDVDEFIIDDNAPTASENYHDDTARTIAGRLAHNIGLQEVGPRAVIWSESPVMPETTPVVTEEEKEGLVEESAQE